MKTYLEKKFAEQFGQVTAIELGGQGSNLFKQFSPGFFKKTLGVSLVDRRTPTKKQADNQISHNILPGDIYTKNTQEQIVDWANGDKIDILIERMVGGVKKEFSPNDLGTYFNSFAEYYSMMSDKGDMFIEVPQYLQKHRLFIAWLMYLNTEFKDSLEIKIDESDVDGIYYFRLTKKPNAPKQLPLLNFDQMTKYKPKRVAENPVKQYGTLVSFPVGPTKKSKK